jgi:hypothetical protein
VRAPADDANVLGRDLGVPEKRAENIRPSSQRETGGNRMKYALSISAALLLAFSQPASAQQVQKLVSDSVQALGGADALRNLKSVSITGEAKY